jgi:hypothetical protein
LWSALFIATAGLLQAQSFTAGNLVVVRVGSGAAALSSASTQVALSDYSTAGVLNATRTFQSSTTIPAAGAAPFLNVSGTTANEGFGSTAINGSIFALLGYNVTNATASVNGSASTNLRAVGRATANGTLSVPLSALSYGATNTIRSVATDGTSYWATTSNTTAGNGLVHISAAGTVTSLTSLNGRGVGIFNGQLFATAQASVQSFGTGLPTTSGQTGTTVATVTNANAFSFSPNHDVLYVADESAFNATATSSGGIRKFTRAAGTSTWTFQYTLNSGAAATTACRGLVVDWSGASPVIYATVAASSANAIIRVTDDGTALSSSNTGGTAPTTIVAGVTNIRLAGLAFAPGTPSIVLSGAASVAPHTRAVDNYNENQGPIATATSTFVVNGYNLSGNVTVTAPTNFQVSTSATSGFASSITLTPSSGSVSNQTVYVRLAGSLAIASYSGYVSVTSAGVMQPGGVYVTGTVNAIIPSITAPAVLPVTQSGFVTTAGTASAAQNFTITAANLENALTLTASSGYEISTSAGSGYASSLNLGTTINSVVVYVRVAASATTATTSGTVISTSADTEVNNLTIVNMSATVYSGQFTTGNIVVQVIGDGTSGLSNAASQVNLWELNATTGALVNPFVLPRAGTLPTAAPFNVTESGSATSGGQLIRSSNGAFLSVSGYNQVVGIGGVVATTTPANKRVLATVGSTGVTTTSAYDFFSGNNFRSTASNGYSYWCAGTVNAGVGLYYLQNRNATPVSLGSINTRVINVYNNNLYFSSASTGGIGIYQAGNNGLPVRASDAAVTRLTDNTYATTAGGSPYSFSINPAGNILYIADDASWVNGTTQRGGVVKYTKTGSTWSYQYTLRVNSTITNGARGLEVDWSGADPVLYITAANGTQIYKMTDTGSASTSTQLGSNAPTNYAFRGLQFAPVAISAELTCTANTLDFGGQPPLGVSAEKVFNVSGSGFTGNITVSVPSTSPTGQYGISLTPGGPYTSSLTINAAGSPNSGSATIYMVFQPDTEGTYNGNLTISATGATSVNVPVTGACIQPVNYYNILNGDVTSPLSWGTNTDGSGTRPVNFTDNGQYFNMVNNPGSLASMQTTASLSPSASTTSGSNILTFTNPPSCPNSPTSLFVGATISGAGIPAGTTVTDITGNVITLSQNATATNATLTASVPVALGWTISGTLSKLIVGNGTNAVSFTIPATVVYSGIADVKNNGTLVLQNSTLPTLGVLEVNSTVNYNQSGSSTVVLPSANGYYGNLTLQGTDAAVDIRNLPASSPVGLPFQVLGNLTVNNVTVLGASGAPFTYMGLQGNLTASNGAIFGGSPVLNASAVPSILTLGDGNQTFSFPNDTIGLYILSSTKSAGTFTLGNNTTLLTYGQSGTFTGTQFIYSGTASVTSNTGSVFANTANANLDVIFTGAGSFNLGGAVNANSDASAFFTTAVTPNSSVYFDMGTGTTLNDGGNTITVSNHFGADGDQASYNLTGTLIMAPSNGATRIQNTNSAQGLCVAQLNNLTIAPTASAGNISIQPLAGNNTLTIKGNLTIGGTATGSKLQPNNNTIAIKGNFADSRTVDMIAAGGSTFLFNGTTAQTFSSAFTSGESCNDVVVNNAAGVTFTSGDMRITGSGSLACQSGVLNTGSGKVILNTTATISETSTSYVLGNVESTRTLTNVSNNFGGIGFSITATAAEPGVTTVLRNTGNSTSVGCSNSSILRNFNVSAAVNTGLNAAISFGYNPTAELNGLNQGELDLFMGSTALNANAGATSFSKSGVDGFTGVITAALPQVLFYLDADADGYAATGPGSTQLACSSPGATWVTTPLGSDCDDANSTINPLTNEICDDFVDNDCDGSIDELCSTLVGNDSPTYATNVLFSTNNSYPNCYAINGNFDGAADSPQSVTFTGSDEWYRFTAQSTGVSITLSSANNDDVIELYQKVGSVYNLMPGGTENTGTGLGDFERLNYTGLTTGVQYYVSVGAVSGLAGGSYSLCIQHLMPSTCATVIPAGGLNICDSYKATYRGAPSQGVTYTFNFTPTGATGGSATSLSGTNGLITLSNPTLALRYAGTYAASVDVRYNLLNSASTAEPIDVLGSTGGNCANVVMRAQPNTEVRSTQRCNASLLRSNWLVGSAVSGDPKACGVQSYTYEFTQVVSCADGTTVSVVPSTYTTAGSTPYLQLGVLPLGLTTGAWNVRISPNFSYGSGTYGPMQRIQVAGTAASGELLYEVVDAEKALEVNTSSIYPNPSNGDFVNVSLSSLEKGQLQLRVLDAAGRSVTSRVFAVEGSFYTTLSFDEKLNAGVYMIETRNAGRVQTQRLVVQ